MKYKLDPEFVEKGLMNWRWWVALPLSLLTITVFAIVQYSGKAFRVVGAYVEALPNSTKVHKAVDRLYDWVYSRKEDTL